MKVDIAIVGGGLVGGSLGCALASSGLRVVIVEPNPARTPPSGRFDQRVYALSRHSRQFLEKQGIWQRLVAERVAPVHEMLIFGDDGASRLEFSAYRSGVAQLAAIVEESNLQQAVSSALAATDIPAVMVAAGCESVTWRETAADLVLSNGDRIEASLVVAADGAQSGVRGAAGIGAAIHDYGQQGVVANFHAQLPHGNAARQWFCGDGVLALLPLPQGQVSMVWSTADEHAEVLLALGAEELAAKVQEVAANVLGELKPAGAAKGFPLRRLRAAAMVAPRLALVGDAAHNVHPLAGQGLNLGFGDADALAQVLLGRGMENDCGSMALLRRYARSRKEDLLAMEYVTDGLQALFASRIPGVPMLRNAGLNMTDKLAPLKRFLVKRALG